MSEKFSDMVQLMAQTSRGDLASFERLYSATSPRLYGLCLRMLGNRHEAEDVLQEIYIKVWHHAGEYHPERGAPLTWIISIGRYACMDVLRQRRGHQDVDDLKNQLRSGAMEPQQAALASADEKILDRCLRELSDEHRASIQLAYFHGLTHGQMARTLGRPLGTVKSWVRRGLDFMRRCLER